MTALCARLPLSSLPDHTFTLDAPFQRRVLCASVAGHCEKNGHTVYVVQISCMLRSWTIEKRLSEFQTLHDYVKDALGRCRYALVFCNTPFACRGGLPGTTSRLDAWTRVLLDFISSDAAPRDLLTYVVAFFDLPNLTPQYSPSPLCKAVENPDPQTAHDIDTPRPSRHQFDGSPLLLRLISAHNVPQMDRFSESDVYVLATLTEYGDERPVSVAKWPTKWNCNNPRWDSCRLFGMVAPSNEASVRLEFFDRDELEKEDDFIGTTKFLIRDLNKGPSRFEIDLCPVAEKKSGKHASPCYCVLKRESPGLYSGRKTIWMVRHGQSVWNKAQSQMDFVPMLANVDHPLDVTGREQAERLQQFLLSELDGAKEFVAADYVMCSPLMRAIQTCLIGLESLLQPGLEVELNPNLREKRNMGGRDSSGQLVGDDVHIDVARGLFKLYPDQPERAARLSKIHLGVDMVQDKWWRSTKERRDSVRERLDDLLSQVHFSPHRSIVLVGHSHLFREFFRCFRANECKLLGADGVSLPSASLDSQLMSNAGVAKCDLDFGLSPFAPVTRVQLLFDTSLIV